MANNADSLTLFGFGGKSGTSGDFKGKHVTATWSGDTLEVNLDKSAISRPVAVAAAAVISRAIALITTSIRPSTAKYREAARKAFADNKPWAMERYTGRSPGAAHSTALFNDSGTVSHGVEPRPDGGSYSIITTIPGVRNKYVVAARLRGLVPELRSAKNLGAAPAVRESLGDAMRVAVRRPKGKRASASVFGKTGRKGSGI